MTTLDSDETHAVDLDLDSEDRFWSHVKAYSLMTFFTVVCVVASYKLCLLYTSPSPRDATLSRMPSSA